MTNSNVQILSLQGKTAVKKLTHPNNSQSESPGFKHSTGCNGGKKISFVVSECKCYFFFNIIILLALQKLNSMNGPTPSSSSSTGRPVDQ